MNQTMTPEQFVYWLQGFLEITNPKTIDEKQTEMLKQHLNYVFNKGHLKSSETMSQGQVPQGQQAVPYYGGSSGIAGTQGQAGSIWGGPLATIC